MSKTSQLWANCCMKVPIWEVHAPNHIKRKSRYVSALKTRWIKGNQLLRQRMGALNQVQDVAFAIREKHQAVAGGCGVRLSQKLHAATLQRRIGGIEVLNRNRHVAQAGIIHLLIAAVAFGGNDLEHGAVGSLNKIIALVVRNLP